MSDFYAEMADMAAELLASTAEGGLGQGEIILVQNVTTPAANSWDLPTVAPVETPLQGVAFGVSERLVDGKNILATDLECTISAEGLTVTPTTADTILLDGEPKTIVAAERVPVIGTPVIWTLRLR